MYGVLHRQRLRCIVSEMSKHCIFHMIGDVYVDILCYIPNNTYSNCKKQVNQHDDTIEDDLHENQRSVVVSSSSSAVATTTTTPVLPLNGSDTSMHQPVIMMAGGSTLNTATYFMFLQQLQENKESTDIDNDDPLTSKMKYHITVHTMFNPNDHYGSILQQHAKQYHIQLQNRYQDHHQGVVVTTTTSCTSVPSNSSQAQYLSTPHCIVMVSSSTTKLSNSHSSNNIQSDVDITTIPERTFLTHRGCATNMTITDLFPPSAYPFLSNQNDITQQQQEQPIHIHIAGYYCTPGFWKLSKSNIHDDDELSTCTIHTFLNNVYRSRCHHSKDDNYTHTATTIVSLVTQYDASETWDIQMLQNILPMIHICIMNESEAMNIYHHNNTNEGQHDENNIYTWFQQFNPSTIFVITKASNGAIAFRDGTIIASIHHTVSIPSIHQYMLTSNTTTTTTNHIDTMVMDPTGAGDAFCAGFLHSLWESIQLESTNIHQNNSKHTKYNEYYTPTEYYWPNSQSIQNALLWGCTVGTCSVTQRGASIPPSNPNIIQYVYDQYKNMSSQ